MIAENKFEFLCNTSFHHRLSICRFLKSDQKMMNFHRSVKNTVRESENKAVGIIDSQRWSGDEKIYQANGNENENG